MKHAERQGSIHTWHVTQKPEHSSTWPTDLLPHWPIFPTKLFIVFIIHAWLRRRVKGTRCALHAGWRPLESSAVCNHGNSNHKRTCVYIDWFGLLEYCILATLKVISGWVATCDNVRSCWAYRSVQLGNQAPATMPWYTTLWNYPDSELTNSYPIQSY